MAEIKQLKKKDFKKMKTISKIRMNRPEENTIQVCVHYEKNTSVCVLGLYLSVIIE